MRPPFQLLFASLVLCSASCGTEDAGARVVFGITTDMAVGFDIEHVETTTRVDGVIAHAERLSYGEGDLSLPAELAIPPAQDGGEVELSVAGFRDGEASPFVTRRAATRAQRGRTLLLPISLDEACAAVTCADDATCAEGACVDPFVPPSSLADYEPTWIAAASDACKTPSSTEPTVVIGQGQSAFAPLKRGEIVPIEAGPQGGHHLWLALRATGLRQMGSRLSIRGYFPELAFELLPMTSVVTLRKAEEDVCEIYGLRFQVDRDIAVETVQGRALDIDIVLEDVSSDSAKARVRVVIAP